MNYQRWDLKLFLEFERRERRELKGQARNNGERKRWERERENIRGEREEHRESTLVLIRGKSVILWFLPQNNQKWSWH